ncbi:MAG TPA: hypothetical protein PLD25_18740 [Chloroflexota bacterium]|nr:hypothetical protein [Chloroflexota bacterium]HUM70103.1 hypothetical protein [Chloroflexota bacterium]
MNQEFHPLQDASENKKAPRSVELISTKQSESSDQSSGQQQWPWLPFLFVCA